MLDEKIKNNVETALDPDTFDVLDYIDNQEVAVDEATIYVNVSGAKKLSKLVEKRQVYLAEKRALEASGKGEPLGLDEAFADTEFDDEINELVTELDKTALTFELKTVAPSLVRAIDKHYIATTDKDWDKEAVEKHNATRLADLFSRTITSVRRGDGKRDTTEWDADRLKKLEEKVYEEQFAVLIGVMYEMVYSGTIFEEVLTADFS